MQDGFYLSAYLNPPGLHRLYDVALRHDHNLSLWEKRGAAVTLVRHWELERITGEKQHSTGFARLSEARRFIGCLLEPLGLALSDMVEVWGTPGLATCDDYHQVDELPGLAYHSVAHLYSAVLMDSAAFFDGTIVGLAVDRMPDRVLDGGMNEHWFAGCVVDHGTIECFSISSPGPLYGLAKDCLGMREGTLMALATATVAAGRCDRRQILDTFDFTGPASPRNASLAYDLIHTQVRDTMTADPRFSPAESLAGAVMKEIQAISVTMMEDTVEQILAEYALDPATTWLALAGGYALNCPTNTHLMNRYRFAGLLAPPCVNDSGQSIGIALRAFHKRLRGARFDFAFPGAYLGRPDQELDAALADHAAFAHDGGPLDYQTAVSDVVSGPVAWFDGRAETGPRALGHRSLLADPRSEDAKDRLNDVKRRQWWRPVAPLVLEEHLDDWFEDSHPSPYMLEAFTIRPDRRDLIPAVAHLDHSARVQTLTAAQNPRLYNLVQAFHQRTGVPILCNTSLNDNGEPIVDTIAEAINFCLRKRIPVAYLNGRRVAFTDFERYTSDRPAPRISEPFAPMSLEQRCALKAELNPHGLPDTHLLVFLHDCELSARYDVGSKEGVEAVGRIIDQMLREPGTA